MKKKRKKICKLNCSYNFKGKCKNNNFDIKVSKYSKDCLYYLASGD